MITDEFLRYNFYYCTIDNDSELNNIIFDNKYYGYVILNQKVLDYFIIIPEYGVYNILYKCNFNLYLNVEDWMQYSKSSYYIIRRNPLIIMNIIRSIYDLKTNQICKILVDRIDSLISENLSLKENNQNLADIVKTIIKEENNG